LAGIYSVSIFGKMQFGAGGDTARAPPQAGLKLKHARALCKHRALHAAVKACQYGAGGLPVLAAECTSTGRRWRRLLFIPLVVCAGAVVGVGAAIGSDSITIIKHTYNDWASAAATRLAQSQELGEDKPVSPADVQKYIAVYSAMQRNHQLTVEQAASRQGMTLLQFRSLEFRIERDPAAHERVLKALREAAKNRAPAGKSEGDR
jgi:hypothetical protein